ncbi:hypothetical protein GF366_00580, partial [Candidatus Peregrinibacteria bacterium]|nr:hypothetical protein [Candidatus Peregrinibacteria bacterium]
MASSIKNPDTADQNENRADQNEFPTSPTGARLLEKFSASLRREVQQTSTDAEIQLGTIRKIQERAEILKTTLDKKIIDLKQLPGQINFLYLLLLQYCAQNSPVLFNDVEEKKTQVDLHFNALEQAKKHFRPEIAKDATSRILQDHEFSGEAIKLCQEFLSAATTLLTVSEHIHTYKTETARNALQNVDIPIEVAERSPLETQKSAFYNEVKRQTLDPLITNRPAETDKESSRLKFVEEVVGPYVINNMIERLTKALRDSLPNDADFESRLLDLFATKNLNTKRYNENEKDTEKDKNPKEPSLHPSDEELIESELSRAKTILLAAYATEPEERAEFYRELMTTHALSQVNETASQKSRNKGPLYGPDQDHTAGIQKICRDKPELLGEIQAVFNTTKTTFDLTDNPGDGKSFSETLKDALPKELALYGLRYLTDDYYPALRTRMESAYTETATALRSRQELSDPFTPPICDLRDVPKVIDSIRQQASVAVYGSEDPAKENKNLETQLRSLKRQLKDAENGLKHKQEILDSITDQEDNRNRELEESIATMRQRLQENRIAMQKNDETIRALEAKVSSLESRAGHQNKQLLEAKKLFTRLEQTLVNVIGALSKLDQVNGVFANSLGNIPEKQRAKAGLNLDPEELKPLLNETKSLEEDLERLAQEIEQLN